MNQAHTYEWLADKYGVVDDTKPLASRPEAEPATARRAFGGGDTRRINASKRFGYAKPGTKLADHIGTAVTRVDELGQVIVPTQKYDGYTVRGHWGDDGLYYEWYRSEPEVNQPIDSMTALLMSGLWEVQPPDEADEKMQDYATWCDQWRRGIKGGWRHFVMEGAACQIFGSQPFEPIWSDQKEPDWAEQPVRFPTKFGFRETNTIDEWISDRTMDEPMGARFQSWDESYVLTTRGKQLVDYKLILPGLFQRGANYEGNSTIRPASHWIRTKRILSQVMAVGADLQSIPLRWVEEELEAQGVDKNKKKQIYQALKQAKSRQGPVFNLPPGVTIGSSGTAGEMAPIRKFLEYCDLMIQRAYDNSGKSLGKESTKGGYAQAELEDNAFLRGAPYIAYEIARPINRLIRAIGERAFGEERPVWPKLEFSLNDSKSNEWVKDVTTAIPDWEKYPAVRSQVLEYFGFRADALDEVDEIKNTVDQDGDTGTPPAPEVDERGDTDGGDSEAAETDEDVESTPQEAA